MSLYGLLYKHVLFPAYEKWLRGRNTLRYLEEMEASQWLSPEETHRRQWAGLLRMLEYCESQVPFYRDAFAERGIRAAQIQSPDDLARLPIISKKDLRRHYDDLLAIPYRDEDLHVVTTSGSSGIPVRVRLDHDAYERRLAGWSRGDRWAGWDIGTKTFLLGGGMPMGETTLLKELKKKFHRAISRQKIVTALSMSQETLMSYFRKMNRFRAPILVGYANSLFHFARFIREKGLSPYRPKSIIIIAEKIFDPQRRYISDVFGAPIFERYGCMEFSFIAGECDRHEGMHINCDNLYLEILNEDGDPVRQGETGELVITSLYNYAMPLIRYRIGDLGRWGEPRCSCGRGLPLLAEVTGRTVDMISTSSGKICTGIVFPYILDEFPSIAQYQVRQQDADNILIRLVPDDGFDRAEIPEMERRLRSYLGEDVNLHFETTEFIPLTDAGKFRHTVSEVPVTFGRTESERETCTPGTGKGNES